MNSRAGEREEARKFKRLHCGLLIYCSTAHLGNELNRTGLIRKSASADRTDNPAKPA